MRVHSNRDVKQIPALSTAVNRARLYTHLLASTLYTDKVRGGTFDQALEVTQV